MLKKMNVVVVVLLSFILGGLFGWNICTFEYDNVVTSTTPFIQRLETPEGEISADNRGIHTEEFFCHVEFSDLDNWRRY